MDPSSYTSASSSSAQADIDDDAPLARDGAQVMPERFYGTVVPNAVYTALRRREFVPINEGAALRDTPRNSFTLVSATPFTLNVRTHLRLYDSESNERPHNVTLTAAADDDSERIRALWRGILEYVDNIDVDKTNNINYVRGALDGSHAGIAVDSLRECIVLLYSMNELLAMRSEDGDASSTAAAAAATAPAGTVALPAAVSNTSAMAFSASQLMRDETLSDAASNSNEFIHFARRFFVSDKKRVEQLRDESVSVATRYVDAAVADGDTFVAQSAIDSLGAALVGAALGAIHVSFMFCAAHDIVARGDDAAQHALATVDLDRELRVMAFLLTAESADRVRYRQTQAYYRRPILETLRLTSEAAHWNRSAKQALRACLDIGIDALQRVRFHHSMQPSVNWNDMHVHPPEDAPSNDSFVALLRTLANVHDTLDRALERRIALVLAQPMRPYGSAVSSDEKERMKELRQASTMPNQVHLMQTLSDVQRRVFTADGVIQHRASPTLYIAPTSLFPFSEALVNGLHVTPSSARWPMRAVRSSSLAPIGDHAASIATYTLAAVSNDVRYTLSRRALLFTLRSMLVHSLENICSSLSRSATLAQRLAALQATRDDEALLSTLKTFWRAVGAQSSAQQLWLWEMWRWSASLEESDDATWRATQWMRERLRDEREYARHFDNSAGAIQQNSEEWKSYAWGAAPLPRTVWRTYVLAFAGEYANVLLTDAYGSDSYDGFVGALVFSLRCAAVEDVLDRFEWRVPEEYVSLSGTVDFSSGRELLLLMCSRALALDDSADDVLTELAAGVRDDVIWLRDREMPSYNRVLYRVYVALRKGATRAGRRRLQRTRADRLRAYFEFVEGLLHALHFYETLVYGEILQALWMRAVHEYVDEYKAPTPQEDDWVNDNWRVPFSTRSDTHEESVPHFLAECAVTLVQTRRNDDERDDDEIVATAESARLRELTYDVYERQPERMWRAIGELASDSRTAARVCALRYAHMQSAQMLLAHALGLLMPVKQLCAFERAYDGNDAGDYLRLRAEPHTLRFCFDAPSTCGFGFQWIGSDANDMRSRSDRESFLNDLMRFTRHEVEAARTAATALDDDPDLADDATLIHAADEKLDVEECLPAVTALCRDVFGFGRHRDVATRDPETAETAQRMRSIVDVDWIVENTLDELDDGTTGTNAIVEALDALRHHGVLPLDMTSIDFTDRERASIVPSYSRHVLARFQREPLEPTLMAHATHFDTYVAREIMHYVSHGIERSTLFGADGQEELREAFADQSPNKAYDTRLLPTPLQLHRVAYDLFEQNPVTREANAQSLRMLREMRGMASHDDAAGAYEAFLPTWDHAPDMRRIISRLCVTYLSAVIQRTPVLEKDVTLADTSLASTIIDELQKAVTVYENIRDRVRSDEFQEKIREASEDADEVNRQYEAYFVEGDIMHSRLESDIAELDGLRRHGKKDSIENIATAFVEARDHITEMERVLVRLHTLSARVSSEEQLEESAVELSGFDVLDFTPSDDDDDDDDDDSSVISIAVTPPQPQPQPPPQPRDVPDHVKYREMTASERYRHLKRMGQRPFMSGRGRKRDMTVHTPTTAMIVRSFSGESFMAPMLVLPNTTFVDARVAECDARVVQTVCQHTCDMRGAVTERRKLVTRALDDYDDSRDTEQRELRALFCEGTSHDFVRAVESVRRRVHHVYATYIRPWHALFSDAHACARTAWMPSPATMRNQLRRFSLVLHDLVSAERAPHALRTTLLRRRDDSTVMRIVCEYARLCGRAVLKRASAQHIESRESTLVRFLPSMATLRARVGETRASSAALIDRALAHTHAIRDTPPHEMTSTWLIRWLRACAETSRTGYAFVTNQCRCRTPAFQHQGDMSCTVEELVARLKRNGASEQLIKFALACDATSVTFHGASSTYVLAHRDRAPEVIVDAIQHAAGRCSRGVPNEIVTVSFHSGRLICGADRSARVLPQPKVRSLSLKAHAVVPRERAAHDIHSVDVHPKSDAPAVCSRFRGRRAEQCIIACDVDARFEIDESDDALLTLTRGSDDERDPIARIEFGDSVFVFVAVERQYLCPATGYVLPLDNSQPAVSLKHSVLSAMSSAPQHDGESVRLSLRGYLIPSREADISRATGSDASGSETLGTPIRAALGIVVARRNLMLYAESVECTVSCSHLK